MNTQKDINIVESEGNISLSFELNNQLIEFTDCSDVATSDDVLNLIENGRRVNGKMNKIILFGWLLYVCQISGGELHINGVHAFTTDPDYDGVIDNLTILRYGGEYKDYRSLIGC